MRVTKTKRNRRRFSAPARWRRPQLEQFECRDLLTTITLSPIADNTIFEEGPGNSNGAGQYLFSGQAFTSAGIRRGLLKFNVAGSVPTGASISNVSLQLHVSKIKPLVVGPHEYGLHRVVANWGEGTSDALGEEGTGTIASTNDATWSHRFFNQTVWNNSGGDFIATPSSTTPVGDVGFYEWAGTSLVADVQRWVDAPATQFGWMIKEVDETAEGTSKRFDSKESPTATFRPRLTIDYTAPNAAPTLDPIGNPAAILEDAPLQTVNLSGISAGINESQALRVTATSSNTTLIPHPSVNYTSPAPLGSLTYTPVTDQSGTCTISVVVRDAGPDGVFDNQDDATTSRLFTVKVDSVNDRPTLNAIPDPQAISRNAGEQTINLFGISAGGGESQVLVVSAISSAPGLIPDPTPVYTSPNATGMLRYSPVANEIGTATITVSIRDAGLDGLLNNGDDETISQTFSVRVELVNEPPTLNAINDPAPIDEDADNQTIFLSGITAGPSDVQPLTVSASSNNPVLIPNVVVNYTNPENMGSLGYRPAADRSGTAKITVTVRDAGLDGTLGNADDGLLSQTITVVVNPVNDPPTLDAIGDRAPIDEDAPLQTVNLSGISAGPQETQTLQLSATASDPGLIPSPQVSFNASLGNGTVTYQPAADKSGLATITVVIRDAGLDGTLGNGDDATLSRSFSVTVNAVNDPPTLDAIPNPTAIVQDSGEQTINLTGITAGPSESQTLLVTANSDNTGLIPIPEVSYTNPNSTGSLRYTPVAGQFGSAVITVTVRDPGSDGTLNNDDDAIVLRQFTVLVNSPAAVNQPPSFVNGGDQSANDFDGEISIPGWASSISPGPPAEEAQTVSFLVSTDVTGLFATQPFVDSTGKLTFTPAANAHGVAVVTIRAKDNGGTDNGGSDTSDAQAFNITINKPHRWHNTRYGLDVSGDAHVVAGDALDVINYINAFGSGGVPVNAAFGPPYYDTDDDNFVAAGDALDIINHLNAFGSGGTGPAGESEEEVFVEQLLADYFFQELGTKEKSRRRAAS